MVNIEILHVYLVVNIPLRQAANLRQATIVASCTLVIWIYPAEVIASTVNGEASNSSNLQQTEFQPFKHHYSNFEW